ncbi:hypothetical protein C7999DRAFT_33373 [Corynascus novoguineensis]|uniref:Uncharacterized protein n=1 Tax=Corynascus novoguineensis TaxID=1126955 RepID=A0AAN7CQ24_9PEZI|nr:hypothetical protein C7999DRAFT_33373 [Corynascus novoguineensis]
MVRLTSIATSVSLIAAPALALTGLVDTVTDVVPVLGLDGLLQPLEGTIATLQSTASEIVPVDTDVLSSEPLQAIAPFVQTIVQTSQEYTSVVTKIVSEKTENPVVDYVATVHTLVTDLSGGLEGIQGVLGQSGLLDTVEQSGLTATLQGPLNSFVALVGNVVNTASETLENLPETAVSATELADLKNGLSQVTDKVGSLGGLLNGLLGGILGKRAKVFVA